MAEQGSSLSPFDKIENRVSPEKQEAFIVALRKRNLNVTAAAKLARVDKASLYKQRKISEEFAQAWADVENELLDDLEERQYEAALEKGEDRRYILSRRRGSRWSEKQAHASKVTVEHRHATEMTDQELENLLGE
jgi:DnaJ-domain-containing protein 1|tara:strand:+ start:565 stop:969 length:405 start_codon:yes stop_codon:yes gene_type:complete